MRFKTQSENDTKNKKPKMKILNASILMFSQFSS